MNPKDSLHRSTLLLTAGSIALLPLSALADHGGKNDNQNRVNHYRQINLVADVPGVALLPDSDLVNAWGISFRPSGSPFWISDNGMGLSTLYSVTYDAQGMVTVGKVSTLSVAIPGEGNPTGQLANSSGAFNNDSFIFASEDGIISGWRGSFGIKPGSPAEILVQQPGAVYKGITLAMTASGPMLLAANFANGSVDAYDSSMTLKHQFTDSMAPAGYAPFNVQVIAGMVFVTFAKQDDQKHDDVPGAGHGLIDVLNPDKGTFTRFATGSDAGGHLRAINSPWGMALSPNTFGKHADQLLVGNFGSGTIMSFAGSGEFEGVLLGLEDGPVMIDGLWGLTFGGSAPAGRPSTLYFTAGPDHESHGLFGSLDPARESEDEDDD